MIVANFALVQHGVFSREQALEAGFTASNIDYRLKMGRWICVDVGVYKPASTPDSWELTVMAACVGGPAAASHRAGARMWNLPPFRAARPEVTAYRHRRRRSSAVVWHESRYLDERRDITRIDGIPVTSVTRTLVDLSSVASAEEIEIALDDACHRNLTSAARVGAEMERLQRKTGNDRIQSVLELKTTDAAGWYGAAHESPLETRTAVLLRQSDLPRPVAQFEVFDGRRFVARLDFAWPDRRVALEVDGFSAHANREAWESDRARQSRLGAVGWRIIHVTHRGLADPESLVANLRSALSGTSDKGVH